MLLFYFCPIKSSELVYQLEPNEKHPLRGVFHLARWVAKKNTSLRRDRTESRSTKLYIKNWGSIFDIQFCRFSPGREVECFMNNDVMK